MANSAWTLVVAKQGTLRESLRALVATAPVAGIVETDDLDEAEELAREYRPALLLMKLDLSSGDPAAFIARVRRASPHTRCVVLTNGQKFVGAADSLGADVAVLEGFRADRLMAVINQFVP